MISAFFLRTPRPRAIQISVADYGDVFAKRLLERVETAGYSDPERRSGNPSSRHTSKLTSKANIQPDVVLGERLRARVGTGDVVQLGQLPSPVESVLFRETVQGGRHP